MLSEQVQGGNGTDRINLTNGGVYRLDVMSLSSVEILTLAGAGTEGRLAPSQFGGGASVLLATIKTQAAASVQAATVIL